MKANKFGIFGMVCAALFAGLLGIKAGWFSKLRTAPVDTTTVGTIAPMAARDVWINIRQAGRKIGFGHETLTPTDTGIELNQRIQMRLNTLGLIQEIRMQTAATLNRDYSLKSFRFGLQSGSYHTRIEGIAKDAGLQLITTTAEGAKRRSLLPLEMPLYLPAGITAALSAAPAVPGDEIRYPFFDPATLGRATLLARYLGRETITLEGRERSARHWRLAVKGAAQSVWLSPEGELLKEEGILGISLERTTRDEALRPPEADRTADLIQLAAITPDRPIDSPETRPWLQVEILGLPSGYPSLAGGRQYWDGRRLSIKREDGPDTAATVVEPGPQAADLAPAPLIESDHVKIRHLAKTLAAPGDPPRTRVKKIMAWLAAHIERRPVVSVPSALVTLEQGRGDCNEHAVLFAALARASGIAAQVEAGIVYLKGRFYYHAWNRVYLDKWVTVDALFGQLPADVTHIRLARGSTADQLNLLGVLGRLKIKVLT
jgi:transglutaminase-like putative cysteine protease